MTNCTRCDGCGFLNAEQLDINFVDTHTPEEIVKWLHNSFDPTDVQVCDCCGDGDQMWYGTPGSHYGSDDLQGLDGPYAYNGGLCECH